LTAKPNLPGHLFCLPQTGIRFRVTAHPIEQDIQDKQDKLQPTGTRNPEHPVKPVLDAFVAFVFRNIKKGRGLQFWGHLATTSIYKIANNGKKQQKNQRFLTDNFTFTLIR
jgi:hypothetical protein